MEKKNKAFEVSFGMFHMKWVNPPDWAITFVIVIIIASFCWMAQWVLK